MTAQLAKLGDICEINPRPPRDHGLEDDSEVSFVPMAAVSEVSGTIESATLRRYSEVKKGYTAFSDGDVLFAKITPCMENGKAALASGLAGGRGFGSTEFHVLRARGSALPEWIYYFVRRENFRREAKRNFTGTAGQQRVPTSFLEETLIPVPPLEEQRRIVDLLARNEGIVRLRREAQEKAAELIPAIFVDMFGDPAMNPRGWPMSAIERICSVRTGATPRKEERRYYEGGTVPWVRTGEVQGRQISEVQERITELAIAETNCKVFPVDTTLVAMYGQGQTRGRAGLLKTPAATNQACAAILPSDDIAPRFLFEVMNLQYDRLRAMGRGGNQANLNLGMIKEFQIPCPPMDMQLEFVGRSVATESILEQQETASEKAVAAFNGLLSRAFG